MRKSTLLKVPYVFVLGSYQDGILTHCKQTHKRRNELQIYQKNKTSNKIFMCVIFRLRVVNDTYVGVSSRSELFNATVWTNVFNAVTKRDFVLN